MSEQSKMWAVTKGEYSDYHVCGIFESEALAREALANGMGDDVAEFDYFTAADPPVVWLRWHANMRLNLDGSAWEHQHGISTGSTTEWARRSVAQGPPKRPDVHYMRNDVGQWISADAASHEAAVKAVSDRVAKIRAEALEATP